MVAENKSQIEPIVIADKITKVYPLRRDRKKKRGETISSYIKKEISFNKKENLFKALDEVSFKIYPGESVGVVGRNGSGKSTLLRVLTGITQPTSGNAIVNGTHGELFSLNSGFDKDLAGIQNIYLYAAMKGIPRNEIKKRVPGIIEFSELKSFIDQPIKTYSSGMKGRLGFSLVTANLPKVMFIDEALGVGDANFRKKCDIRFEKFLYDKTRTIIIVSHNIPVIRKLCSRVIWLDKGIIRHDGKVNEVVDEYLEFMTQIPATKSKKVKILKS